MLSTPSQFVLLLLDCIILFHLGAEFERAEVIQRRTTNQGNNDVTVQRTFSYKYTIYHFWHFHSCLTIILTNIQRGRQTILCYIIFSEMINKLNRTNQNWHKRTLRSYLFKVNRERV